MAGSFIRDVLSVFLSKHASVSWIGESQQLETVGGSWVVVGKGKLEKDRVRTLAVRGQAEGEQGGEDGCHPFCLHTLLYLPVWERSVVSYRFAPCPIAQAACSM